VIERRAGRGWRRIKTFDVDRGKVFTTRLTLRGRQKLRAGIAGEKSLPWPVRG